MPDILRVQRELTEWFITNGPPSDIVLVPQIEVREPGKGVKKTSGTPRAAQWFKKIWPGGDGFQSGGQDGSHHKFDLIIVGVYNCVAELGDQWFEGDQKYVIHSEFPDNGYERKFGVNSYGSKPADG